VRLPVWEIHIDQDRRTIFRVFRRLPHGQPYRRDLVILDTDISLLQDTWWIRDADDRSLLAEINSRGALVTLARKFLPIGQGIAHKYEITSSEGGSVGAIEVGFALFDFDQYEIVLTETSAVPIEPVVSGAIVIDASQGS
jgi:hypothetical protein